MTTTNEELTDLQDLTEKELIATARRDLSASNWKLGQIAALWCRKYAKGRTDRDLAAALEISEDKIYKARRVWEQFHDFAFADSAPVRNLEWSHFYAALTWPAGQRDESLLWAEENGASVAEMKAWTRIQLGDEMQDDALPEAEPATATQALSPVSHDPAETVQRTDEPYSPYGTDARDLNRDRTRQASAEPGSADEIKARRKYGRALQRAMIGIERNGGSAFALIRELLMEQFNNGALDSDDLSFDAAALDKLLASETVISRQALAALMQC